MKNREGRKRKHLKQPQEWTPTTPPHGAVLNEAQTWLHDAAESSEGAACPCCTRLAKVYKRKLTHEMAWFLVMLARAARSNWDSPTLVETDIRSLSLRRGDYARVRAWSLAEPVPDADDPTVTTTGLWRLTKRGWFFARDHLKVPKYAVTLFNDVQYFDGPLISVAEALGDHFNYAELWAEGATQEPRSVSRQQNQGRI